MVNTIHSKRITRPVRIARSSSTAGRSQVKGGVISAVFALMTALSAHAQSRGELLYSTHCLGCHTTEMHWRDARVATDWAGVVTQVRRWQSANSLSWNEQDVFAVARYLNESFYHFKPSAPSPAASTGTVRSEALPAPFKQGRS
jgi:mono/diheme cytochrome c family protein